MPARGGDHWGQPARGSVDGQVPRDVGPRTRSGPEGSSLKRSPASAADSLARASRGASARWPAFKGGPHGPARNGAGKAFGSAATSRPMRSRLDRSWPEPPSTAVIARVVRRGRRPGARRPHALERDRARPRPPRLPVRRLAGDRQDLDGEDPRPLAQLRQRADAEPCGECESCVVDRRRHLDGRDRDGRRLEPLASTTSASCASGSATRRRAGQLEGLHPRRGPHAHPRGLERVPEDARGAASEHRLRARHDRGSQGDADDRRPLPALRLPPPVAGADRRGGAPGAAASSRSRSTTARSARSPAPPAAASATRSGRSISSSSFSGERIATDDVLAMLGVADAELLFGAADAIAAGERRRCSSLATAALRCAATTRPTSPPTWSPTCASCSSPGRSARCPRHFSRRRAGRPARRAGRRAERRRAGPRDRQPLAGGRRDPRGRRGADDARAGAAQGRPQPISIPAGARSFSGSSGSSEASRRGRESGAGKGRRRRWPRRLSPRPKRRAAQPRTLSPLRRGPITRAGRKSGRRCRVAEEAVRSRVEAGRRGRSARVGEVLDASSSPSLAARDRTAARVLGSALGRARQRPTGRSRPGALGAQGRLSADQGFHRRTAETPRAREDLAEALRTIIGRDAEADLRDARRAVRGGARRRSAHRRGALRADQGRVRRRGDRRRGGRAGEAPERAAAGKRRPKES